MKKILFALVLVFVGLFAFGCGGNNGSDKLKVGLIVSAAGPNDNGYNQFAIEGLRQAERDFNITVNVVTTADDIPGSLTLLAEEGYDLVFSLEYNFDALITNDGSGKSIAENTPTRLSSFSMTSRTPIPQQRKKSMTMSLKSSFRSMKDPSLRALWLFW